MYKELKKSGLPLYLNEETNVMAISAPLIYNGFGAKTVGQMPSLFEDDSKNEANENVYDVYRNIRYPEDEAQLVKDQYSYDITIVKPGKIGMERKKTSGHYHQYNEMHTSTYPEVYEVISGTAIYVLQRADNFEDPDFEKLNVEDVIVVRVEAGQSIIIPANYAHCSVNGGEGALVFSNLCYAPCKNAYEIVKYYHGLAVYVNEVNGRLMYKVNDNYKNLPKVRYATVKENQYLGIIFNKPVYQAYKENPAAFRFLGNVDDYRDEIMTMLDFKEEI